MKRIITLALAAIMTVCIFALVGCDIEEEPHVHSFGEWRMVDEASCTEEGKQTRVCACGENEFMSISALGHSEVTVAGTPATCTESGLTEKVTCQVCGEIVKKQTVIPSLGHNEEITVTGTPATCTEIGLSEGKKCSVCGEVTAEQEEISPLGHKYDIHTELNEDGSEVIICTCQRANCGLVKENPSGLYDADNNLLASWYELVNVYGLNGLKGLNGILKENEVFTNGTMLIIDDSITEMDLIIFEYCPNITKIMIPSSVTRIKNTSWSSCIYLEEIAVNEKNEYYKSIDGNLYDKEGKTFIQYASGKTDTEFAIPNGVTNIGTCAFTFSNNLKSIVVPVSVTEIEAAAFHYCDSLKDIYYNGTEEQWEFLNYTRRYMPDSVYIHYGNKIEIMTGFMYNNSGMSGTYRLKIMIEAENIYISDSVVELYDKVGYFENLEFTDSEYIIERLQSWNDDRLPIMQKIFANEEWYVLETILSNGLVKRIAICEIDDYYYFVSLYPSEPNDNNKVFTIHTLKIKGDK